MARPGTQPCEAIDLAAKVCAKATRDMNTGRVASAEGVGVHLAEPAAKALFPPRHNVR